MKISFCTTTMNRLFHLRETLLKNLDDNDDYDNLEFVILNYNSQDKVDEWIKETLSQEINSGRVVYYKESEAKSFIPSHARNICALMASGDVICNVDADNFTGVGFANHLARLFRFSPKTICCSKYALSTRKVSTHGRLALSKKNFLGLGGYNEDFLYGWGGEDNDLFKRCQSLHYNIYYLTDEFLQHLEHDDNMRIQYINFDKMNELDQPEIGEKLQQYIDKRDVMEKMSFIPIPLKTNSRRIHEGMSDENIQNGKLIVNENRTWGSATLLKNFHENVISGYCKRIKWLL